jgi:membrane protease YdiL (CAAX protease family)
MNYSEITEMPDSLSSSKNEFKKRNFRIWAILWAIFPPIIIFALFWAALRPTIRGKVPDGISYILWILGLICLSDILQLPFGSIETIAEAFRQPEVCKSILIANGFATIVCIFLIVCTFRNKFPTPYLPIKKFYVDKKLFILWLLSFLPLLNLLSDKPFFTDPNDIVHPLLASFAISINKGSYYAATIGFITVGFLGPFLEEIIFRGLLLETSHEEKRSKYTRLSLDILSCTFFAVLHLPVSFFVPFTIAAALIYVRRHTGSLLPCIGMHATWNCSILTVILLTR